MIFYACQGDQDNSISTSSYHHAWDDAHCSSFFLPSNCIPRGVMCRHSVHRGCRQEAKNFRFFLPHDVMYQDTHGYDKSPEFPPSRRESISSPVALKPNFGQSKLSGLSHSSTSFYIRCFLTQTHSDAWWKLTKCVSISAKAGNL